MKSKDFARFPGSKHKVDFEDYLSQYAVVCETPLRKGYDALLTGGGDLVGVVYTPDNFKIIINKSDILTQIPKLEAHSKYDNQVPIHAAKLEIKQLENLFNNASEFSFTQSVYNGVIKLKARQAEQAINIEVWAPLKKNMLIIDILKENMPDNLEIELSRTINNYYGTGLSFGTKDKDAWIEYAGENDVAYAVAMHSEQSMCVDKNKIVCHASDNAVRIYISVFTSNESQNPLSDAKKAIDNFLKTDIETQKNENKNAWNSFWSRSFIHTSQFYLNNLWYLYLYHMAIAGQGGYPTKFNGSLFNWREDDFRIWGGPFWSLNQTRSYGGLFNSDHMELFENMCEVLDKNLPIAKQNTKYHYGIDGIWMPEMFPHIEGYMKEINGRKIKDCTYPEQSSPLIFMRTAAAQWSLLYWRKWKFTGDIEFLRSRVFPFIKGVADFYVGFVVKKDDGKYHIPISRAIETQPAGEDSISDLSCIKWLFPAVIEAADILNIEIDCVDKLTDILQHLADYPICDGYFANVIYKNKPFSQEKGLMDWLPEKVEVLSFYHWQTPYNYPVFPWGVIDEESPEYSIAKKSYLRNCYNTDFACGDNSIPAARLGLKDEVYRQLHRTITINQIMKQGLFSEHAESGYADEEHKEKNIVTYLNASGAFAQLVNESFIQGHGEAIKIFPAFPEKWEGVFSLLCEKGFFVSSHILPGGEVAYVAIESRFGNICKIRNPWKSLPYLWRLNDHKENNFSQRGDCIEFPTEKNHTYVLESQPGNYENTSVKVFQAELKPQPKMLGSAVLGKHKGWNHHAQTWSVW